MTDVAEPIFVARNIAKRFRGLTALSGVEFQIARGEIWASSGPTAPARRR